MLLELSLKYFLRNHQRAVKGVKIIALGLIILSASGILIASFNLEITGITNLLDRDDQTITIQPLEAPTFTSDQYKQILDVFNFEMENGHFQSFLKLTGNLYVDSEIYSIPILLTDLDSLGFNTEVGLSTESNKGYISEDLKEFTDINLNSAYNLTFSNLNNLVYSNLFIFDSLINDMQFVDSGLYLHYEYYNSDKLWNMVKVDLSNFKNAPDKLVELEKLEFIQIDFGRPETTFINTSTNQIVNVLVILQSIISILVILNISNLFSQLIFESKRDIQILRSVGYSRNQVRSLFVLISILMGLISFILSVVTSYILVSLIVSILILFFNLSPISLVLPNNIVLLDFINGIIVSIISSMIAVYRGVKK